MPIDLTEATWTFHDSWEDGSNCRHSKFIKLSLRRVTYIEEKMQTPFSGRKLRWLEIHTDFSQQPFKISHERDIDEFIKRYEAYEAALMRRA